MSVNDEWVTIVFSNIFKKSDRENYIIHNIIPENMVINIIFSCELINLR